MKKGAGMDSYCFQSSCLWQCSHVAALAVRVICSLQWGQWKVNQSRSEKTLPWFTRTTLVSGMWTSSGHIQKMESTTAAVRRARSPTGIQRKRNGPACWRLSNHLTRRSWGTGTRRALRFMASSWFQPLWARLGEDFLAGADCPSGSGGTPFRRRPRVMWAT